MDDEEENVSLVCKKCNKEFISKIDLTNHINKKHLFQYLFKI